MSRLRDNRRPAWTSSSQPNTTRADLLAAELNQIRLEVKSHRAMMVCAAAFVQQFVYRPDRGQYSVLLAAHPANGGQQPQLGVDYLQITHAAEA